MNTHKKNMFMVIPSLILLLHADSCIGKYLIILSHQFICTSTEKGSDPMI